MGAVEIIEGMPAADYHAAPGLSASGLDDLAVSPLRYWHRHINPNREPEEPTRAMVFGSALHAAVLEPEEFDKRYYRELDLDAEYPNALRTMEDLRGWLKARDIKPAGTRKADLVQQIAGMDSSVEIADLIEERYKAEHAGKTKLSPDTWQAIGEAADALRTEPRIQEMLAQPGKREVSVFVDHPETGVRLKIRPDFLSDDVILDLKTISIQDGKSFDDAVRDAIWFRAYYRRAYFYSMVMAIADGNLKRNAAQHQREYVLAFVESQQPHETRICALRPFEAGSVDLLWAHARFQVYSRDKGLIQDYADWWKRCGVRPWRQPAVVQELGEDSFPQLAWVK